MYSYAMQCKSRMPYGSGRSMGFTKIRGSRGGDKRDGWIDGWKDRGWKKVRASVVA